MAEQTLFDLIPAVKEDWRAVVGLEGRYEVSNRGRVRNVKTRRIRKIHCNRYGYPSFQVEAFGFQKTVHLMVCEAFIGPRPVGLQVNHKNLLRDDNRLENLEYCTPKENIQHGLRAGAFDCCCGERQHRAKLTEMKVRVIRRCREIGVPGVFLSRLFGITPTTVCKIYKKRAWRHIKRLPVATSPAPQ